MYLYLLTLVLIVLKLSILTAMPWWVALLPAYIIPLLIGIGVGATALAMTLVRVFARSASVVPDKTDGKD